MRPGRPDIAVPELPPNGEWLLGKPATMAQIVSRGPALVHFFDFAQLNSIRTLPYLAEWESRYASAGLTVLGVQAPRFPFGATPEVVTAGLERLGIGFPVILDGDRELWFDYGCEGWPSLFLWGRGGSLRWYHFGEGEYLGTETAIQEELRALEPEPDLPDPLEPLRPTDGPDARVVTPTAELFPGGSTERPWVGGEDGEEIALDYAAGGAYATVEGSGPLEVEIDGEPGAPIDVDAPGLYELASHPHHQAHSLRVRPAAGLRIWSLSFAPGIP